MSSGYMSWYSILSMGLWVGNLAVNIAAVCMVGYWLYQKRQREDDEIGHLVEIKQTLETLVAQAEQRSHKA